MIDQLKNILDADKFRDWMKKTDENFSTDCVEMHLSVVNELTRLKNKYAELMAELHSADEE